MTYFTGESLESLDNENRVSCFTPNISSSLTKIYLSINSFHTSFKRKDGSQKFSCAIAMQ